MDHLNNLINNLKNEIECDCSNEKIKICDNLLAKKTIQELHTIQSRVKSTNKKTLKVENEIQIENNKINDVINILSLSKIIPFHVGFFFVPQAFESSKINELINIVNEDIPDNQCTYDIYILDGNLVTTRNSVKDFINKYGPEDNYVCITSFSTNLLEIDNYLNINTNGQIPCFSADSTASVVRNLKNGISLAPDDSFLIKSFYMTVKNYSMTGIKLLYEESLNSVFINGLRNGMQLQANLLGIPYIEYKLEIGKSFYDIRSNDAVFLAINDSTSFPLYITNEFIENIPSGAFIGLPDTGLITENYFKDVPTFVFFPRQNNYTKTSLSVYQRLINKENFNYTIYSIYDMLYTFGKMSISPDIKISLEKYVSFTAFKGIQQAWNPTSDIKLEYRGFRYGLYQLIFTKDVYVGPYLDLYLENYLGGTNNLPKSYSIFRECGLSPDTSSGISYKLVPLSLLYNQINDLVLVTNYSDFTKPIGIDNFVSQGGILELKFAYNFDIASGYFNKLEYINLSNTFEKLTYQNL